MDAKIIGNLIKKLREQKGLSQYKLAEALFVDRTAVTKWENGKTIPSVDMLLMISNYFNISIDELVYGSLKNNENDEKIKKYPAELFQSGGARHSDYRRSGAAQKSHQQYHWQQHQIYGQRERRDRYSPAG